MPTVDVNDVFGPDVCDTIVVVRRSQTMVKGRAVITEKNLGSVQAVIGPIGPDDLQRLPEGEYFNKAIQIITPFRLQGVAKDELGNDMLPDHVLWHGSVYVIQTLDDFAGYGRGFISATATSISTVDPQIPPAVGNA